MRVFAGLPLPDSTLGPVEEYINRLKQVAGGLNYVKPQGLHITIHFFGELSRQEVDKVLLLMEDSVLKLKAIPSGLQTAGQFPPRGNPRVLFLNLMPGTPEIAACHNIFTGLLKKAGFPCEDSRKPFVPHLTVARNKRERLAPGALEGISVPQVDFSFNKLVLYKSVLTPRRAEYTALKTVLFI